MIKPQNYTSCSAQNTPCSSVLLLTINTGRQHSSCRGWKGTETQELHLGGPGDHKVYFSGPGFPRPWKQQGSAGGWGQPCPAPPCSPHVPAASPRLLRRLPPALCLQENYFLQSVCHSRAISILPQFGLSFSLTMYLKEMIPQAQHFSLLTTHGKQQHQA